MSVNELSEYIRVSKYAQYNKEKGRRETWDEQIDRVMGMHKEKYADCLDSISEELTFAEGFMRKKKVLGSQRALQFGGYPILSKHGRMFNCTASYIDRVNFFQEGFWLALCGCGVGFSVQKHHIEQLPRIRSRVNGEKIYVVEDSIEGWADALGVLLSSFFIGNTAPFPEYQGYVVKMDFSKIRPEGAPISSSGAKAPGPKGLIASLSTINNLLLNRIGDKTYYKLQPIDAYDIVCHTFDAVLSGGVRRSSAICLFSKDDEALRNAKTGNWLADNPQRARANNSVVLLRDETTKEEFDEIMLSVKEFGEPGFIWADDTELLLNPCQSESALFLTQEKGIQKLGNISIGDIIWTGKQWSPMINKWSTGVKPVYRYTTSNGYYTECTENHRIVQNGKKIEIKDAECIDKAVGVPTFGGNSTDTAQAILAGLVLGDGSKQKNGGKCAYLNIGEKDGDHYSHIKQYIEKVIEKNEHRHSLWKLTRDFDSLNLEYKPTPERTISDFWMETNAVTMCAFLKGLYSANGSIIESVQRVTYKGTSKKLVQQIQIMLSALGIRSYRTTNKPSEIEWDNGVYTSKESYDLNITSDTGIFKELIGFTQKYKMDKIKEKKRSNPQKSTNIVNIEYLGDMEVFDYTVEAEEHTVWQGGLHLSNCAEVGLLAKHSVTGESGWQACNLSEGNMAKVKTEEEFYAVCEAASIIGTLQAGYTNFEYLGPVSKDIMEGEALIGVSMTGIMDSPDIAFNPAVLRKGAKIVKGVNKALAKKLGINPAARTTLVKPSGTASAMLGTASGIHPHHANRYFRLVQANKHEETLDFFRKHNPFAIEESVWDSNNLTDVITFCCEVPAGAKTKNQINAIDFLEKVKLVQTNWVMEGKDVDLCAKPWLSHNVSNTIHVMPHEWDDVTDFIFKNRAYFTGISLIPQSGDKDYPQSPFTAVYTPNEIVKMYGDASIFASGLVVHGIKAFDENVWEACNAILGYGKPLEMPDTTTASIGEIQKMAQSILDKEFWIKRATKFADRYFDGDVKKMTYCLKDVYNWKRWVDLKRDYVKVPWTEFYEDDNNTKFEQSIACSGGSCEIL